MRAILRHGWRWAAVAAVIATTPSAAQAATDPAVDPRRVDDGDKTEAEPIVVSSRHGQRRRGDTAASVDHVSRERALRQGARTAPEQLEESAGVSVQQTNRGAGAPILRGLIGPSNLLAVDGLRYHQSTWRTGPNQALATLEPSMIESMEVLLGPASVLYGSGAMGGVIDVRPSALPELDGVGGDATLRLHSVDRAGEGFGRVAVRRGDLALVAGGGYRNFGALRLGGGDVAPISAYAQGGWHGRVSYDLNRHWTAAATVFGSRVVDAGRADQVHKGDLRWYDNGDDMGYVELRHDAGAEAQGVVERARVAVAAHRSDERVERLRCTLQDVRAEVDACVNAAQTIRDGATPATAGPVLRRNQDHDAVLSRGALASATLRPLGASNRQRLALTVGGEAWGDEVTASTTREARADKGWAWVDGDRGSFSPAATWLEIGAFALAEAALWQRGDLQLGLDVGGRFAHFRARADAVPGVGDVAYDASGAVASASLRLAGPGWLGYLSWNQGFRAPNLQETTTLGDTGSTFEVPNDALRPERSDTLELGARLHRRRVSLHAAIFAARLGDAIDSRAVDASEFPAFGIDPAAVGSKPVRQRVNASEATIVGAQLDASARLGGWIPWLRVAMQQGDVVGADGVETPFRRVPPLGGAAGLRFARPRWSAEAFARFAAAQDRLHPGDEGDLRICEDPDNLGKTYKSGGKTCPGGAGWVDVGLRGGFAFSDHLRLDVVARNLLDARYRVYGSGIDAAGLGASAALSGRF